MPPNPPAFIDLMKSSHCCGASTPDTSIGKRVERLLKGTRAPRTDAPFRRRSEHTPPGGHRRSCFVCDQVGDRTANNCNKC